MSEMIAYGAHCTWWDDKEKVGVKPSGLPCCPHCGGVLFEIERLAWWNGVNTFVTPEVANYREVIIWSRGRCFKNPAMMYAAYNAANLGDESHKFEPYHSDWVKPRCKVCREFEDHPVHTEE